MEVRLSNSCCRGKVVIITYSECAFVALVIQRAKFMRCVMWSASVCMAVVQSTITVIVLECLFLCQENR
jgi:hypothetical protein